MRVLTTTICNQSNSNSASFNEDTFSLAEYLTRAARNCQSFLSHIGRSILRESKEGVYQRFLGDRTLKHGLLSQCQDIYYRHAHSSFTNVHNGRSTKLDL